MSKACERETSEIICEWQSCDNNVHRDMAIFLTHLRSHCEDFVRESNCPEEESVSLCCLWYGCSDQLNSVQELFLHVSYHGFHSKLMSNGLELINMISRQFNKKIQCFMDSSTRTILPPLPSIFVCGWEGCHGEFLDAESFYRHVETHPVDVAIPSLSKEALKNSKFAKCLWNECNAAFNSRTHLKEHLKSHSQEKYIACPNCGAMFRNKKRFCDHLLRQMEFDEKEIESITVQVTSDDQQYTVTVQMQPTEELRDEVGDEETSVAGTTKKQSKSAVPTSVKQSLLGYFYCSHCDKEFRTVNLFREHNRSHFQQYKCEICGKIANSPSSLKHHMIYRHSNDRPFACQFCESKFKSRSDLRKHISIHNEDNPFKCNLCPFECRCCHTLAKHQKQHQSVNNEYVCHECKKKFTRGNNLTRHLITIHKYSLKPDQSRFTYCRQPDGTYRLEHQN